MSSLPEGVVRTPDERFAGLPGYPFPPTYQDLPHPDGGTLRMHAVDEGPREGPVVLLCHGEPTWSYLYRKLVPILVAGGCRAIAPDLIGFGRSDKLVEKTAYTFERHVDWLHAFVVARDLRDVTLVCQDWGGPIGLGVLAREPDRFARVVAGNTMLHTVEPEFAGRLAWSNHGVGDGDAQVAEGLLFWMALSQRMPEFHASASVQGATRKEVPPEVLAAYDAPFPDERYKAGMRQFPILIPVTRHDPGTALNHRTWEALRRFDRPFLTLFGDSDPGTGGWDEIFRERVPGARGQAHETLSETGHFWQEDRGEEVAERVLAFLRG